MWLGAGNAMAQPTQVDLSSLGKRGTRGLSCYVTFQNAPWERQICGAEKLNLTIYLAAKQGKITRLLYLLKFCSGNQIMLTHLSFFHKACPRVFTRFCNWRPIYSFSESVLPSFSCLSQQRLFALHEQVIIMVLCQCYVRVSQDLSVWEIVTYMYSNCAALTA